MNSIRSRVRSISRGEWFLFAAGFVFITPFLAMFVTMAAALLWWSEGPCA